ncbi:hypothetical protein COV94_03715, partial [Candidatus Woesearchaeota archaeon CG11_big_fil_rev_8_21_14_0_20_57_5]
MLPATVGFDMAEEYRTVVQGTREVASLQDVLENEVMPQGWYALLLRWIRHRTGKASDCGAPEDILGRQLDIMDGLSQSLERMAVGAKRLADGIGEQYNQSVVQEEANVAHYTELSGILDDIDPAAESERLDSLREHRNQPGATAEMIAARERMREHAYSQGEYAMVLSEAHWLTVEQDSRRTYTDLLDVIAITMAQMRQGISHAITSAHTTRDVYIAFKAGRLGMDAMQGALATLRGHVASQHAYIRDTSSHIAERAMQVRALPDR